MSGNKSIFRAYKKRDDMMLELSQTLCSLFESDKSAFVAEYPLLADPFAAQWQEAIDFAQNLPLNTEERAEQKFATEDKLNKMEEARVHFQRFASYVRILFPSSKASQGIFGLDEYSKARYSAPRLVNLLNDAHKTATAVEYEGDLIASGFVAADIAKLLTLSNELDAILSEQKEIKSGNRLRTEERIAAYNKVWEFTAKVSNASKQVFMADYARYKNYKLYPEIRKKKKVVKKAKDGVLKADVRALKDENVV